MPFLSTRQAALSKSLVIYLNSSCLYAVLLMLEINKKLWKNSFVMFVLKAGMPGLSAPLLRLLCWFFFFCTSSNTKHGQVLRISRLHAVFQHPQSRMPYNADMPEPDGFEHTRVKIRQKWRYISTNSPPSLPPPHPSKTSSCFLCKIQTSSCPFDSNK